MGGVAGAVLLARSLLGRHVLAGNDVAVGGNIGGSQIVNGISPERLALIIAAVDAAATNPSRKLDSERQAELEKLGQQLGTNAAQLLAFCTILAKAAVKPEQMGVKLLEITQRQKETQAQVVVTPDDDPAVAKFKTEAKKALDRGDLDRADALLAEVQKAQDKAADPYTLEAAATRAQRAGIALTRLHYGEAASLFAAAAERVPSDHEMEQLGYLESQAEALYQQGDKFEDNETLEEAIELYRRNARQRHRERAPLDWALTQTNLGNALERLGERSSGTAWLQEAVTSYRTALEELTREQVPLDWALTQTNLGNALEQLGERQGGTVRLVEAVAAFHAALEELTRERMPLDWALTQNSLGNALRRLGERENGTARLEEAVTAYRAALEERTRERVPLDWALTQTNLGNALERLGERQGGTARLEEAVTTYRAALEERTRERVPLDWAYSQHALANALAVLAVLQKDSVRMEQAITCLHGALEVYQQTKDTYWLPVTHQRLSEMEVTLTELKVSDVPSPH